MKQRQVYRVIAAMLVMSTALLQSGAAVELPKSDEKPRVIMICRRPI